MILSRVAPLVAALATGAFASPRPLLPRNEVHCEDLSLSISVNANSTKLVGVDDHYSNQTYITNTAVRLQNLPEQFVKDHVAGTFINSNTYKIYARYCTPKNTNPGASLVVGVHGQGFDSKYWDFDYKPEYSLVNQAAAHGYPSLIYDRLGTGKSEAPDSGFLQSQVYTEIEILAGILKQLRDGTAVKGKTFSKIVGVGHSYGSITLHGLTVRHPDLLNGVALTGYAKMDPSPTVLTVGNWIPGRVIDPKRFAHKPSVWLASGSAAADEAVHFWATGFAPEAFDLARSTISDCVTIGSSAGGFDRRTTNFTGAVFAQAGAHDYPQCLSNCTDENISGVQEFYPRASNFSYSIVPNTGHSIALHFSSSQASMEILDFFKNNRL
jgi:pimeloyl-ACP methyl ester carboxylesterase